MNDGAGRHLVPGLSERSDPYYTFCHLDDRMGNTNHLSDAAGSGLTSTLETDAFGVETYRVNPGIGIPTRSGFAGAWGYENEGGGINLVGNRWYDADAGRFLTRDPARHGSNWWNYCENDPVNAVDPTGFDPGDEYDSEDDAANDALDGIWAKSKAQNLEYAGVIYRKKNGKYSYSASVKGSETGSDPTKSRVPHGVDTIAYYHSHGDTTPGLNSENFSTPKPGRNESDTYLADFYGIDGYLITPKKKKLKYDVKSRKIQPLPRRKKAGKKPAKTGPRGKKG